MAWIDIGATVLEAGAVVAASIAAWRSLGTWRHQMTAGRKAELAERTLAMFYEAREIIAHARNPGAYSTEGQSRPGRDSETEEVRRYKDSLFVAAERLSERAEFWGRFGAIRYEFWARFGENASKPFDAIWSIRNRIAISSGMLVRTFRDDEVADRPETRARRQKWEDDIGWWLEQDPLAPEIDAAVSAMEAICRPAILGK